MARNRPREDWEQDEWRNPLKPFVVAMTVILLLLAFIIVLLYIRLQTSNEQTEKLTEQLTAVQSELDAVRSEQAAAPAPTEAPTPTPEVTATPAPTETPEPTEAPTATPEPTATPSPLLRDTITDEELNGAFRPADEAWFDSAKDGTCSAVYMLALRWGPGMEWNELGVIMAGDPVEVLAKQNSWFLIRTKDKLLAWCAADCIRLTEDGAEPTAAATANGGGYVAPVQTDSGTYVPPAATTAPTATPVPTVNTEVSNPDLSH